MNFCVKKKRGLLFVFILILLLSIFLIGTKEITGMLALNTSLSDKNNLIQQSNKTKSNQFNNSFLNLNLTSNYKELIEQILLLRNSSQNERIILIAKHYSILDEILSSTKYSKNWRKVSDCVYSFCEPELYLDLIYVLVNDDVNDDLNKKIKSLINTVYLWNGNNEALFSKSLTNTNNMFLQDKHKVKSKWNELIECNGCSEMYNKSLEIINLLVKYCFF